MFRRSDELTAVMRRMMNAIQTGDTATARALIARRPETLLVGNRGEWLYGVEALEVLSAQLTHSPDYERTFHTLEAYEDGRVGWGAATSTTTLPSGRELAARHTAVFYLDEGIWRIVQWHASVPGADSEEWFDVDLPRSLSELVDSLDDDLDAVLAARFDTPEVSLLISDIEDSTRLGVEFGDALWSDVVNRHFDQLERIATANKGTVVKTMGDGALIAFDVPVDASRAAIDIQESVNAQTTVGDYRVRIGVHMGPVVHSDDDYFGYTVNKTARLASAAAGTETLVSESVARAIGSIEGMAVGEPRHLDLKGLPGMHKAYPLTGG